MEICTNGDNSVVRLRNRDLAQTWKQQPRRILTHGQTTRQWKFHTNYAAFFFEELSSGDHERAPDTGTCTLQGKGRKRKLHEERDREREKQIEGKR